MTLRIGISALKHEQRSTERIHTNEFCGLIFNVRSNPLLMEALLCANLVWYILNNHTFEVLAGKNINIYTYTQTHRQDIHKSIGPNTSK